MDLFTIIVILFFLPLALIALLVYEHCDKQRREKQGLPPKKYHDITDEDVTTIYTIRRK